MMKKKYAVGDKVGMLELIKEVYVTGRGSKGKMSWVCRCDCGAMLRRREDTFVPGRTSSCGCTHPNENKKGPDSPLWKGCGEIGGTYFGNLKKNAERRGLAFTITIEFLHGLYLKQNRQCALTGLPIVFNSQRGTKRGFEHTASTDRIDSMEGYVEGNVWLVHKTVNLMKREFPLDVFGEMCRRVTERLHPGVDKAVFSA